MLIDLLNQVTRQVASLDVETNAPTFAAQIRRARPELIPEFLAFMGAEKAIKKNREKLIENLLRKFARGYLHRIREIPDMVKLMIDKINDPQTDAPTRCAVTSALCYLVQPHDLIPDDAPGGYGFVDDCILLRASLREYMRLVMRSGGVMGEPEQEGNLLLAFAVCIPAVQIPVFEQAIGSISMAMQFWRSADPDIVEFVTTAMMANPLMSAAPQLPQDPFHFDSGSPSVRMMSGGGSIYTEGSDISIMFPGGGSASLVGGQLVGT